MLLCAAQFLGYAHYYLFTPTFPLYVTHLGGSPFVVGLVLASFSISSVIFRPIIGYWADRWNPAGVMIFGLLMLGGGVLLCFIPIVETSMLANILRGVGWSGLNAGGYSILASVAPPARRGEASGYYSGAQGSANIVSPALALYLLNAPFGGFQTVFLTSMLVASLSAALGVLLGRSAPFEPSPIQTAASRSFWSEFFNMFEREVRIPAALLFCLQFSLPAASSFVVLYARHIGVGSITIYFIISGTTSLLARPLLGRFADRIGWGRAIVMGFLLEIAGLILLVMISSLTGMIAAGTLYMLGSAIGSAAILALALERANPQRRGRALASYSLAFPLGTGLGAFITGLALEIGGYFWTYLFHAAFCACGALLVFAKWNNLKQRS